MTETTKFDFDDEATGPKPLRDFAKEQAKQNKELKTQLDTLIKENRTRTVTEALKSKGVDEKVAKFVPTDATTPEAVDAWLAENGDVFGYKPGAEQTQQVQQQTQQLTDNSELARQFADLQAVQDRASNLQGDPGTASPQRVALEKAAKEGGTGGITEFLRSIGAVG